jgi:hypothetical protein
MTSNKPMLVSPDSVRVWRGFRLPGLELTEFYKKLGAVFIPATVLMQIQAGLHSYTPAIPAGIDGKPATVPDETAILFWETQNTYSEGFGLLAVRTYTLTHNGVYQTANNQSRADFPIHFTGSLTTNTPVYLINQPADWMHGSIKHFIAARPTKLDTNAFVADVAKVLMEIQATKKLEGAIACISDDYFVYWELANASANQPNSGIPLLSSILSEWNHAFNPIPTDIPAGLWDQWKGLEVGQGSSFNMQFKRRIES